MEKGQELTENALASMVERHKQLGDEHHELKAELAKVRREHREALLDLQKMAEAAHVNIRCVEALIKVMLDSSK